MTGFLKEVFLQTVVSSLKLSVVVIALLLLTKPIEKKYTAGFRYYSWLAVMIVFLIPFHGMGIGYRVALPGFLPKAQYEARQITARIEEKITEFTAGGSLPEAGGTSTAGNDHAEGANRESGAPDLTLILAWLWLAGGAFYFALHMKRYLFFRRAVKRFSVFLSDERVRSIFAEEQKQGGPPVRISKIADTPLLTGLFHPMLILPHCKYTDEQLHLIFRHELTHYRRKDIWYQFFMMLFLSLHWFNPFAYLMAAAVEIDGETSCDESVLKGCPYETRIFYGEMLITFLKTDNQKKSYLTTTFFGGKNAMKKRLNIIASKATRKNGIAAMAVLLVLTTLLSVGAAAATPTAGHPDLPYAKIYFDDNGLKSHFVGCEPIYEENGDVIIPLKSFAVFVDYKVISEKSGEELTISNGNREISVTADSTAAKIDEKELTLTRNAIYQNDDFYVCLQDLGTLFSLGTETDGDIINLTVTDETPEADMDFIIETPEPTKLPAEEAEPTQVPIEEAEPTQTPIEEAEPTQPPVEEAEPTQPPIEETEPTQPPVKYPVRIPEGAEIRDKKRLLVSSDGVNVDIYMNYDKIIFPDAQPFLDSEDRTQVPLRAISEIFDCTVDWNEAEQLVTITGRDTTVKVKIGDRTLYAGDKAIEMDTEPIIIDGRTYIPIRFVSEALKINVYWDWTDGK